MTRQLKLYTLFSSMLFLGAACGGELDEPELQDEIATSDSALAPYQLIACPNSNDVPSSGYAAMPGGNSLSSVGTPTKVGTVCHRVDLNNVPAGSHPIQSVATARFTQYEGIWAASKEAACRNSYVHVTPASKLNDGDPWVVEPGWTAPAVPVIITNGGNLPNQSSIIRCEAIATEPETCDWISVPRLRRFDVRSIADGNESSYTEGTVTHRVRKNC